jgi:S-adenosylmethionine:tRNA ribosyltransferase-isomerase
LEHVGKIPLPPYIKRDAINTDTERYQTIFAKEKGSVAAPTAGLHFTDNIIGQIQAKNIPIEYITLHVGAGTFKPVSSQKIGEHDMHCEQLFFSDKTIEHLLNESKRKIIAVGTTTARSLESLYWIGVKLYHQKDNPLHISQWEVYENFSSETITVEKSLETILNYMKINQLEQLHASTALMITPFYTLKMLKGIVTNFHQPKSTLLLLISAFVGENWKNIYDYALAHDFRFLSYGDACLFL